MEIAVSPPEQARARLLHAADPDAIRATAVALRQGHLAIFPTDTVYGIGAHAFDAQAVARLFVAKQRPLSKAIPLLLADVADLAQVAGDVPPLARKLMDRFWPGPLTLVIPSNSRLPALLSPGATVAVRIPDSDVARAVIRAAGGVVAASSANRSGRPPAHTAVEALAELGDQVAVVLDGGPAPLARASTVVDCCEATPKILRRGPIRAADLLSAGENGV